MAADDNKHANNNSNNNESNKASNHDDDSSKKKFLSTTSAASRYFSTTCFSSIFMILYLVLTCSNLYRLMYPLAFLDLSPYPPDEFVKPLWETGTPMDMTVYLSCKDRFQTKSFIQSEFVNINKQKSNDGGDEEEEGRGDWR